MAFMTFIQGDPQDLKFMLTLRVFELCVEITNVDARRHPNLFDLNHMLVLSGLFLPLALFKPELTVVHQLAHRRGSLRRDLNQVQPLLVSNPQRLRGGHNAQLLTLGADQADFPIIDGFIQFMHLFTNGRNTSVPKSQNADTKPAPAQQQTALRQSDYNVVDLFAHLAGGEADASPSLFCLVSISVLHRFVNNLFYLKLNIFRASGKNNACTGESGSLRFDPQPHCKI